MDKSKITKLIAGNIAFAAGMIFAYSPGFMGLRLSDPSIIRAALSVTLGVMMPAGMVGYNYRLLKQKPEHKLFLENSSISVEEIRSEMSRYVNSEVFGRIASSSVEQLDKCLQLRIKVEDILNHKFDKGSLTYNKFAAIAESAETTILNNMMAMLNRMRVIDDAEYRKLMNYKNDDIPDELQIPRLELYTKNIKAVKEQRDQNEGLLYKLDELLLELTASEIADEKKSRVYGEIDALIKQIQYYSD